MYQLCIIAGPDKGKWFTLNTGPDLIMGRSASAHYKLSDPRVSRSHCEVLWQGEQVTVKCLGGSGGTLVNGKPIKAQKLKPGDVLQVGDTQMRLELGDFPVETVKAVLPDTLPPPPSGPATRADKLEALQGQKLSHYDIGPVIGKGESCMVFHATDLKDNRSVALKVLLPEFSKSEEEMQRFIRAMKTMLPLRHPNLVVLYGAGKTGPYCWIAMEYVAGENLMQVISRLGVANMLDWRYGFRVAVHIARALAYAHGHQIIHRNVTPKNILLETSSKTAKLGDLMLAKALEGSLAQQITKPGELVGDIVYMSPERTRGVEFIDGRSDIYGLGATVYALVAGRPPFAGYNLVEQITRIRQDQPTPPSKFQMSIPHPFESIIMKCLEKNPDNRYQTTEALLKDLEKVGKIKGVQA